ncbi:MAG: hypothetical protein Q9210_004880 [Variospora velana]
MDWPQLSRLACPTDAALISPVKFAHDPVPKIPLYLDAKETPFPRESFNSSHPLLKNRFKLYPREARLPFRCSLDAANECRFWKQGLESSMELLKLLSDDRSTNDIVVRGGVTMAGLAQRELRPEFEHRFCKATSYMYPFADEERTKLLAASMVMMFLWDDKAEASSDSAVSFTAETKSDSAHLSTKLNSVVEDFVNRINNIKEHLSPNSRLQHHIDSIISGFRAADLAAGNAGQEVIDAMSKSLRRIRPGFQFRTLRQYLDFRHDNVSADYVLAAVKFSVASGVDLTDPRLARYLTLVKDHLAIINDMASYDKEKRACESSDGERIINIVDVIQRVMSLPDVDSAKVMAYAYQLQTEAWMMEELQHLGSEVWLGDQEWQYLEATYICAAGNAFFSMTSSRYGGEIARLPGEDDKTLSPIPTTPSGNTATEDSLEKFIVGRQRIGLVDSCLVETT